MQSIDCISYIFYAPHLVLICVSLMLCNMMQIVYYASLYTQLSTCIMYKHLDTPIVLYCTSSELLNIALGYIAKELLLYVFGKMNVHFCVCYFALIEVVFYLYFYYYNNLLLIIMYLCNKNENSNYWIASSLALHIATRQLFKVQSIKILKLKGILLSYFVIGQCLLKYTILLVHVISVYYPIRCPATIWIS